MGTGVIILVAVVIAALIIALVAVNTNTAKTKEDDPYHTPVNSGENKIKDVNVVNKEEPKVVYHPVYWIVCTGGTLSKRMYLLEDELTIGRNPNRDICFGDKAPAVSREHATIRLNNGNVVLRDDGSSAGTFIANKGQQEKLVPVTLNAGDVFYIGSRLNSFEVVRSQ